MLALSYHFHSFVGEYGLTIRKTESISKTRKNSTQKDGDEGGASGVVGAKPEVKGAKTEDDGDELKG